MPTRQSGHAQFTCLTVLEGSWSNTGLNGGGVPIVPLLMVKFCWVVYEVKKSVMLCIAVAWVLFFDAGKGSAPLPDMSIGTWRKSPPRGVHG